MNHSSQMLIFFVFVMACILMSGVYFVFRKQEAHTKWLLRKTLMVWKPTHGFCVLGGTYFALFTFQVLAGGFNFEMQLL